MAAPRRGAAPLAAKSNAQETKADREVVGPPAEGGTPSEGRRGRAARPRPSARLKDWPKARAGEAERAAAPARPDRPAPARPAPSEPAEPEPKVPEPTEESKSERKKEAKAQRQRADAPPLPPKDKDGVVGGDTVLFEQIQPNVAYLIENVARKHLEGRAYDVKYHARWTDGITQDCLDQCRALSPNFKWMISCAVVQKGPQSSESVAYYDQHGRLRGLRRSGSNVYASCTTAIYCVTDRKLPAAR